MFNRRGRSLPVDGVVFFFFLDQCTSINDTYITTPVSPMHARLGLSIFQHSQECQTLFLLRLLYIAISTEFDPNGIPYSSIYGSARCSAKGEQRNVLNVVDSLQNGGIDHIIPLPQLVLCGDQFSGKNWVLEAIMEISFPCRENLCTQFATKSVLCRLPEFFLTTKITSHKARPSKRTGRAPKL